MSLFRLTKSTGRRAADPRRRPLFASGRAADFSAWAHLRAQSRDFLTPWEPTWPDDDLTRAAFRRRLRRQAEEMARDESFSFLIFDSSSTRCSAD